MRDNLVKTLFANQWLMIGIVSMLLLAITEMGYWYGLQLYRRHRSSPARPLN